MKKIMIALALMIFLLSGCVSNEQPVREETESQTETPVQDDFFPFDEKEGLAPSNKRFIISEIRIRSKASTKGELVGHVYAGDFVDVLETTENEGYIWYRIGEGQWIADDGTWTSEAKTIKFKSNNGSKEEYIQEYADEQEYDTMDYRSLDRNRFSFDGYIFTGWNTEPDGSGEKIFENSPAKNALNGVKAICLYAQWEPIIGRDIIVEANKEIELLGSPARETEYIQAVLQKGDCFKIYDQINCQGEIWNRISKDLWFVGSDDCCSVIESLPTIDVDFKEFHKPVKVVFGSEEEILHYNGNDLVLIEKSENYYGNNGTDAFFSLLSSWMFPNYRYGPGVTNKYDESGRISEQSVVVYGTTVHQTYTYDSNNRIISKDEWYKSPGDSGNLVHYEYYEDGKLKRFYIDPGDYDNKYTWGCEFEYNGNLVFQNDIFYFIGKENEMSHNLQQLLRFDDLGRLVQVYYPDSPQIEGPMITDYYYE